MSAKHLPKSTRTGPGGMSKLAEPLKSPSSSATSSSKHIFEASADGLSSPASSTSRSKPSHVLETVHTDSGRSKENVTVTVRFRPLSPREIRQGEELAWYADGETIVRNEHNPSIAYAYDRVFGPTTTTRHVYDVASQHVVSGVMEGINGTIFAYGVTSSGKTHTMHGDQRSPGIIPLSVKDAFSIIQETPNREFLLRVSYLEIYNEVVNDLLNPAGQNLRIREDSQGTFIEGIKEEVVLSPAHVLSLIAAGEEHRHVGSTNFNLLSSRSHTIFTLIIESSPCGENNQGEAVKLSQLNLIDLAGSESSKAETTGLRRKEGSYINKSLLTLGTVIAKLTEGRATHIPYRDSKLTRILQSSLSGNGRVSLICTITPASSSSEETHNTLKFAHRAKHIEILASQNKIIDEKSLIKKYQNEIRCLKDELEQLKKGMVTVHHIKDMEEDDIVRLKQKLEDGQVKLQSRLEQEEEAKAVLLNRIQRLTKLILVSSKASQPSRLPSRSGPRRRHSFGEEELAYLPYKRRDLVLDEETIELYSSIDGTTETAEASKEERKTRKLGLLNWLKIRKRDAATGTNSGEKSNSSRPDSINSTPPIENGNCNNESRAHLQIETSSTSHFVETCLEEGPEDNFLEPESPTTSIRTSDQIELLREQQKILSGDVALHSSALKRLAEEASRNPDKEDISAEIKKLGKEIKEKNQHINSLEIQINSMRVSQNTTSKEEMLQTIAELNAQLNQKSFELEVKVADNRIIQDQLNQKINECEELQETVTSLNRQLSEALEAKKTDFSQRVMELKSLNAQKEMASRQEGLLLQSQANEIEELKQELALLEDSKEQLEIKNQKLADESAYAKGLASAAAVELKALSEEVAKLMNVNEQLANEVTAARNPPMQQRKSTTASTIRNGRRESLVKRQEVNTPLSSELKRELALSREREAQYESVLAEKEQNESELVRTIEESKHREAYLENELANMWVLVAKLKMSQGVDPEEQML